MEPNSRELENLSNRLERVENATFFDSRFALYPEVRTLRQEMNAANNDIITLREKMDSIETEVYSSSWWNVTNILRAVPPTKWIVALLILGVTVSASYQFMVTRFTSSDVYKKYFFYVDETNSIIEKSEIEKFTGVCTIPDGLLYSEILADDSDEKP